MGIGAGIGIANFTFDDARGFWRWVDLCDNGGLGSVWQSDRIIDATPNLETMSVMAALAGGSKNLKFGMNVASLGLRHPVLMAKQCATIDVLSEGRLLPAFGIGSARSMDYVATGTPTKGRGKRTDEGLQIMTRLWREDRVNFDGEYYQLKDASIAPKPVQQPLPLWVGGSSKQAIERTAQWSTGWQAGIETAVDVSATKMAEESLRKGIEVVDRRRGWRGPIEHIAGADVSTFLEKYSSPPLENWVPREKYAALIKRVAGNFAELTLPDGSESKLDLRKAGWAKRFLDAEKERRSISLQQHFRVGDVIEVSLSEDVKKKKESAKGKEGME